MLLPIMGFAKSL